MAVNMPSLKEGHIYSRSEAENYIGSQTGTSDFDLVRSEFPRNLKTWRLDHAGCRIDEAMVLQFQVVPMVDLKPQIFDLYELFSKHEEHQARVRIIVDLLLGGEPVFPVFMQQNDPDCRIIEGMHRAVALMQIESHCVPTFLTGYRNWFVPDKVLEDFDGEDRIVSVSRHDAFKFFMHATCIDQKGRELALFGGDRLVLCDTALVAQFKEKTIGAATLVISKGQPTLSTVYVLKQFRRKGVAYRLCEAALQRCKKGGIKEVFCDVQSFGMGETLKLLCQNRPDLGKILRARVGNQPCEELE